MTNNLKFVDEDPRGVITDWNGQVAEDPRNHNEYQPLHRRTLEDIARATYSDDAPADNGNRRRHADPDNRGAYGNDLTNGRQGQR